MLQISSHQLRANGPLEQNHLPFGSVPSVFFAFISKSVNNQCYNPYIIGKISKIPIRKCMGLELLVYRFRDKRKKRHQVELTDSNHTWWVKNTLLGMKNARKKFGGVAC